MRLKRKVIQTRCSCGEKLKIELNASISARADLKRPHYNDSHGGTTVFRCRKCSGWLGDTCKEAAFKSVDDLAKTARQMVNSNDNCLRAMAEGAQCQCGRHGA